MKVLAIVSLIVFDFAVGIPLHMFYPYGPANGDSRLPTVDDGSSSEIYISTPFNFFGNRHRSLFVSFNVSSCVHLKNEALLRIKQNNVLHSTLLYPIKLPNRSIQSLNLLIINTKIEILYLRQTRVSCTIDS